jgi:hypothetical protein
MELIEGLKVSIRERNDETTPRQVVIPENNALCTPSMVASLISKESMVLFEALAVKESKITPTKASQDIFMLPVQRGVKMGG